MGNTQRVAHEHVAPLGAVVTAHAVTNIDERIFSHLLFALTIMQTTRSVL